MDFSPVLQKFEQVHQRFERQFRGTRNLQGTNTGFEFREVRQKCGFQQVQIDEYDSHIGYEVQQVVLGLHLVTKRRRFVPEVFSVVDHNWNNDTRRLAITVEPFMDSEHIPEQLQSNSAIDPAFVFEQEPDPNLCPVPHASCVECIEPIFIFVGSQKRFPGGLDGIRIEPCIERRRQLEFQQCAGIFEHIKSAAEEVIVGIWGVEFIHVPNDALNKLLNQANFAAFC